MRTIGVIRRSFQEFCRCIAVWADRKSAARRWLGLRSVAVPLAGRAGGCFDRCCCCRLLPLLLTVWVVSLAGSVGVGRSVGGLVAWERISTGGLEAILLYIYAGRDGLGASGVGSVELRTDRG